MGILGIGIVGVKTYIGDNLRSDKDLSRNAGPIRIGCQLLQGFVQVDAVGHSQRGTEHLGVIGMVMLDYFLKRKRVVKGHVFALYQACLYRVHPPGDEEAANVWRDVDSSTNFIIEGRSFVDGNLVAAPAERNGSSQTTDARTSNSNVQHGDLFGRGVSERKCIYMKLEGQNTTCV